MSDSLVIKGSAFMHAFPGDNPFRIWRKLH